MFPRYVLVKLASGKRLIVQVRKSGKLISGYAVNKFGDEIGSSRSRTLVVASPQDVICEMEWNPKYAELERKS